MTPLTIRPQGPFAAMRDTKVEVREAHDYPGDLWFTVSEGPGEHEAAKSIQFCPEREDAIALALRILKHYGATA